MKYWLAVGPSSNWTFCFANGNIWGFPPFYKKSWSTLAAGDVVLCYAVLPVKGVIAHGVVRSTELNETPLFPEERESGTSLWPLRVYLTPGMILPEDRWTISRIVLPKRSFSAQRALQTLGEEKAMAVIAAIDEASRQKP